MRNTSPSIIDAFNPNDGNGARHIEWSVRFEIVQDEIYENLSISAAQNTAVSRLQQTIDRDTNTLKIQTFELGGFPLDGSGIVPPRSTETLSAQVGLIMDELSDAEGAFSTPQVYTAETDYLYDLLAVTFDFGFAPPVDFTIEIYGGTSLLHSVSVTGNADRLYMVNHAVAAADKVVLAITKGKPFRFARVAEFTPGAVMEYDKYNSDSLTVTEAVDPISERAAASTMQLVTDNMAEQFDIFDPTGIYQYFKERMGLYPTISGRNPDGAFQQVSMGKYYLQAPQLKGNLKKLKLDATNLLGTLQDTQYSTGLYKTASLAQFAQDVAADAGITIRYPAELSAITVPSYVATMSHAQALINIAKAANMVLRVATDDALEFHALGSTVIQTVGMSDYSLENGISPSDDTIYNTVELEYQTYSAGASTELVRLDASGTLVSSTFYVDNAVVQTTAATYYPKYSPATNISASVSGGVLTVSGQPLQSSPGKISVTSKRENEVAYVYTPKTNPFIQPQNARAVAEYALLRKAQRRRIVKTSYRGYPYWEMGDVVNFNSGESDTQAFFLTKNKLSLGGGMTGEMEAREL
ncbi:MAG: hypothetical protein AAGU32_07460 [Bacillota bacterium]